MCAQIHVWPHVCSMYVYVCMYDVCHVLYVKLHVYILHTCICLYHVCTMYEGMYYLRMYLYVMYTSMYVARLTVHVNVKGSGNVCHVRMCVYTTYMCGTYYIHMIR